MKENLINKKGKKTNFSFFPKNKRFRISEDNLKYLQKEKTLDNYEKHNYISNNKNSLNLKKNIQEKSKHSNSYTNNRLNFNLTSNKWNYNYNFNINSSRPKYNIVSSTSTNFWKGQNNTNKYKFNNFIKKNNINKKSAKNKPNNFTNINIIKNEKSSSIERKYALNSKLFEQFIYQYERKIKKALLEIGINPNKEDNKDYFPHDYNNLPFLNINNNDQKLNNLKIKSNKLIPNKELFLDKNNYIEQKNITSEKVNNEFENSMNSNNGNNNIIFQNSFNKNYKNNFDSYSCNTNVNTINSINSMKGKEEKKIVYGETLPSENNNKLIMLEKINSEKEGTKHKLRAISTNPYTLKTTLEENNDNNNNIINSRYDNNSNINIYFSKNYSENELSKYEIGHTLGKGAYAIVKVCRNKITKEKYAMKIYEKSKLNDGSKKKCVYREIEILKRINHINIAKLYDVIITDKQILILQELVHGISLREYYNNEIRNQKGISEHKSNIFKKIFRQIFDAMNYIHKKNMAHRDIKLENILMTNNYEIKIIDFGFGMYNPQNKLQNFFCGTPNYMPPEIAFKKPYIGYKADLWSLGVLVYKIFCADFPFKGKNEKELYKSIEKGKFKFPKYTTDYARKIILNMIVLNPNKRMTCEEVLKSDWLRD
jgi:tRNA A-37 threonylcarbamoyl transferase component Bud32